MFLNRNTISVATRTTRTLEPPLPSNIQPHVIVFDLIDDPLSPIRPIHPTSPTIGSSLVTCNAFVALEEEYGEER